MENGFWFRIIFLSFLEASWISFRLHTNSSTNWVLYSYVQLTGLAKLYFEIVVLKVSSYFKLKPFQEKLLFWLTLIKKRRGARFFQVVFHSCLIIKPLFPCIYSNFFSKFDYLFLASISLFTFVQFFHYFLWYWVYFSIENCYDSFQL
mgnify:CR=1 FL=1